MGRSQASRSRDVCLSHDHGLGDTSGAQGTDAEPGWGTQAHATLSGCVRLQAWLPRAWALEHGVSGIGVHCPALFP